MGIMNFLLGEKASDVQLDPRLEESKRQRGLLAQQFESEALGGGVTPGQEAVIQAGQRATEEASRGAMSRAAGVGGFGRLAAQGEAQRVAAQQAQSIAANTAAQAGLQRSQDVGAARAGLLGTLSMQDQAAMRDQQLREEQRKKGFLPSALGLAGAGLGGYFGGAKGATTGAQYGGLLGTGVTQAAR